MYEEKIKDYVRYEPESGNFYWLINTHGHGKTIRPGDIANALSGQGYLQINVMKRIVRQHRLAWFFMTGEWPPKGMDIDHINGVRDDNRWTNLRLVTRSRNGLNAGLRKCNKSGVIGVSYQKRRQVWDARIRVDGILHLLGQHKNFDDAVRARKDAEQRLCPESIATETRIARPRHQ